MDKRTTTTRKRVADLTAAGLSVREIAKLLDISTQAVYQHLAALKEGAGR